MSPDSQCRQDRAGDVQTLRVARIPALRDVAQGPGDHDDPQRDVDPERPCPREVRREVATDQRAEGRHPADDRSVDSEGDVACATGVQGVHEGQRGRRHHGPADALQRAGRDEVVTGARGCRVDAGGNEDQRAEREDPPAADPVADAAEDDQQGGERQRIDRVDPLGVDRAQPQVGDHRGQRDVDDRRVHDDQRRAHPDEHHRDPAVGRGLVRARGGGRGRGFGHEAASLRPTRAIGWLPQRECPEARHPFIVTALRQAEGPRSAHAVRDRGPRCGARGGSRTPTPLRAHGPEPCASAYSATRASSRERAGMTSTMVPARPCRGQIAAGSPYCSVCTPAASATIRVSSRAPLVVRCTPSLTM